MAKSALSKGKVKKKKKGKVSFLSVFIFLSFYQITCLIDILLLIPPLTLL